MSLHYQIGESLFFPQKNEIHHGIKVVRVRPKTADLLTVLVEANGEIVSKNELLEQVWSDVFVEEYVIFQSITELRKLFDNASVIKTHPRKGYSITAPILQCDGLIESKPAATELGPTDKGNSTDTLNRKLKRPTKRFLATSFVIFSAMICAMIYAMLVVELSPPEQNANQSGAVIVLPINNQVENNTLKWLTYGGMDILIKHLQSHENVQVMPAEIVLETLSRAGLKTQSVDETAIRRLFQVSEARMIITQTVSGFSGDLQLVYSLYKRDDAKRGAVFADNTDDLFQSLNTKILESLNLLKPLETKTFEHNFTNALMAAAVEEMRLGQHDESIALFQALLVKEPENLLAVKLLAKSLVFKGRYAEAEKVAAGAVDIAMKHGDNRNLGRLFFWQALSLTQQGKYEEALAILHYAKAKNEYTNDLLYLANSARVAGKVYLQQENYELARAEIKNAANLYNTIREPYGQISMNIDLGELELKLGNKTAATKAFSEALKIAEDRNLPSLIAISESWLDKKD